MAGSSRHLRVTLLAMTTLFIASIFCGCDFASSTVRIATVDTEKEANEILVVLDDAGVTQGTCQPTQRGRKEAWEIRVPAEQEARARSILRQQDLPRENGPTRATTYAQSSWIPSKVEERARLVAAIQGEIEQFLETYERVVRARVMIVLPERDPLQRKTQQTPSAAVAIKYLPRKGAEPADKSGTETSGAPATDWLDEEPCDTTHQLLDPPDAPITASTVRELVARSVDGLEPGSVHVSFTRSVQFRAIATNPHTASVSRQPAQRLLWTLSGISTVLCAAVVLLLIMVISKRRSCNTNPTAAPALE